MKINHNGLSFKNSEACLLSVEIKWNFNLTSKQQKRSKIIIVKVEYKLFMNFDGCASNQSHIEFDVRWFDRFGIQST